MRVIYIDESGTPEVPGTSSTFVLAGIAIPVGQWKTSETQIQSVKARHYLKDAELHTAWLLRPYSEQMKVADFEKLPHSQRRYEVDRIRTNELLKLQSAPNKSSYKQVKKNYAHTQAYIHLTLAERRAFVEEVADVVSNWGNARLFAECIDKAHFNALQTPTGIEEQAFEQVVSRFEQFLGNINSNQSAQDFGFLIHDNNQTVAKKHTDLMRKFHQTGTLWTSISNIIETPFFVDSAMTNMVQVADLCAFALRRYIENSEHSLFDKIFKRADQKHGVVVGVRHFAPNGCACKICKAHRVPVPTSTIATPGVVAP